MSKIAFALVSTVALMFAGTAFAGKTSGSSSIAGPFVVAAAGAAPLSASSTTPQFGDTITFDVSTTQTSNPFVNVNCYQNGVLVMNSWSAFFPGGVNQNFGLYSPVWQSGAADCRADLGMLTNNGKWKVLASAPFHVDA